MKLIDYSVRRAGDDCLVICLHLCPSVSISGFKFFPWKVF
jgi:hypothetical protein